LSGYAPTGVVADMVRLRVEDAEPPGGIVIDDGLNVGLIPLGSPETARFIIEEYESDDVPFTVNVVVLSWVAVFNIGVADMMNSPTVTASVC
jgi:hypothetical protein